jgi:hypothetical protein
LHPPVTANLQRQNPNGSSLYDRDIIAWANEQTRLLREGRLDQLDIEHIAEEIEDVGKSEQRELASRMAVLIAHLIKWRYQPERRGGSWQRTIRAQRRAIALRLKRTPSLKTMLRDGDWREEIWSDAVAAAAADARLDDLPQTCPWTMEQVLDPNWLPPSQP